MLTTMHFLISFIFLLSSFYERLEGIKEGVHRVAAELLHKMLLGSEKS